jgi:putative tryptophan/tyrosine transport system substrate-binding protein
MRRRDFIKVMAGSAAAWPLAARAQQPPMPVIGFLNGGTPEGYAPMVAAFRQGLNEAGYVDGQNVKIEYRWADDLYDRLPAMAMDLVRHEVTAIVANTPAVRAAQAATKTIPIVFITGVDPVAFGLVASLNRPGGNLTGVASLVDEVGPKRLELLHDLLPNASTVALLINPRNPSAAVQIRDAQAAASAFGQEIHILNASTESEIDTALATFGQMRAAALIFVNDALFNSRLDQLAVTTARRAIPAISPWREFVVAGGLMSYGINQPDLYRQAAIYVGRVLKGERPADLPVQRATKVELHINLKTAKALGITFPESILQRADEVIE